MGATYQWARYALFCRQIQYYDNKIIIFIGLEEYSLSAEYSKIILPDLKDAILNSADPDIEVIQDILFKYYRSSMHFYRLAFCFDISNEPTCSNIEQATDEKIAYSYQEMLELAHLEDWETWDINDKTYEKISRIYLIVLLKHTGLIYQPSTYESRKIIYHEVFKLRWKLFSMRTIAMNENDADGIGSVETESEHLSLTEQLCSINSSEICERFCDSVAAKCLLLLFVIKGPSGSLKLDEVDDEETFVKCNFYNSYAPNDSPLTAIERMCCTILRFVCNEAGDDITIQPLNKIQVNMNTFSGLHTNLDKKLVRIKTLQ